MINEVLRDNHRSSLYKVLNNIEASLDDGSEDDDDSNEEVQNILVNTYQRD
jgi:hypothetical protein